MGGMDRMVVGVKIGGGMTEDGEVDKGMGEGYWGWNRELGEEMVKGEM